MKIGQKVICTDAGLNKSFPEHGTTLIQDNVYVVSGFKETPNGETGIRLIGIMPPSPFSHGVFSTKRFKVLEEMKKANSQYDARGVKIKSLS